MQTFIVHSRGVNVRTIIYCNNYFIMFTNYEIHDQIFLSNQCQPINCTVKMSFGIDIRHYASCVTLHDDDIGIDLTIHTFYGLKGVGLGSCNLI